jgi:hypothetical protein
MAEYRTPLNPGSDPVMETRFGLRLPGGDINWADENGYLKFPASSALRTASFTSEDAAMVERSVLRELATYNAEVLPEYRLEAVKRTITYSAVEGL